MAKDWEDLVIETGVDTVLGYLAENGSAPVSEIADEVGIQQDRIADWADALENQGLVSKDYTISSGLVLKYEKEHVEQAKNKRETLREDLEDRKTRIEEKAKQKTSKLKELKEELQRTAMDMEAQEVKHESIHERIEELEDMEDRLQEQINEMQDGEIQTEALNLLHEIDSTLEEVEEAETSIDLTQEENKLRKKVKAFQKLQDKIETAEEEQMFEESGLETEEEEEEESGGLFSGIKSRIPFIGGKKKEGEKESNEDQSSEEEGEQEENEEKETEEAGEEDEEDEGEKEGLIENVDDYTVSEVKDRIREEEDLDLEKLLEAEESGKDRKTLKEFIESHKDSEDEEESGEEDNEEGEEAEETGEGEEKQEKQEEDSEEAEKSGEKEDEGSEGEKEPEADEEESEGSGQEEPEDLSSEEIVGGTISDVKETVEELENPDSEALLEAEKEGKDRKTLKDFLKRKIDSGSSGTDYSEIVDGTVDEVKESIKDNELDLEKLLEAEEKGKDRKTLKQFINRRMDSSEEVEDNSVDYSEFVDGNVGEVKDRIREEENLDLKALLDAEENGKDRKTLKQFIERRMDDA
ncbi:MAG: hypothetical protein ABEJ93_02960 [Candidatus Nanohalobium sp.]